MKNKRTPRRWRKNLTYCHLNEFHFISFHSVAIICSFVLILRVDTFSQKWHHFFRFHVVFSVSLSFSLSCSLSLSVVVTLSCSLSLCLSQTLWPLLLTHSAAVILRFHCIQRFFVPYWFGSSQIHLFRLEYECAQWMTTIRVLFRLFGLSVVLYYTIFFCFVLLVSSFVIYSRDPFNECLLS